MDEQPPPVHISPEAWAATPAEVRAVIVVLLGRIVDLEARLNQHSQNSSKPPSSDPPSAPPRPTKVARGRQSGGQPGHAGHHRPLLPPDDDRIKQIIPVPPAQCRHCHAPLDPALLDARPPERRQVWDIPPIQPEVTEYQLRALQCPDCAEITRATPPVAMPPGGYGAHATALAAFLHGRFRLSDHETAEAMQAAFGLPMSEGTVTAVEVVMSAALEPVYRAIQTSIQQQRRVNLDETSWKQGTAGKVGPRKGWLWVAVTHVCTLFLIWGKRNGAALDAMLGTGWRGIITSDRWRVYERFLVAARQLCWAHLKRDITAFFEYARDGPVHDWSARALIQVDLIFVLWHGYRAGELDRAGLQHGMTAIQTAFHTLLEDGTTVPYAKVQSFSRALLRLETALWTFVREEGVEPTNNAAERALRPAVLWRKGCFGTQSDGGSRYVERMLTVIATCKQQDRHLLSFLTESLQAHWAGTPPPHLVQTP